jgi:DNA replication protein DnaC
MTPSPIPETAGEVPLGEKSENGGGEIAAAMTKVFERLQVIEEPDVDAAVAAVDRQERQFRTLRAAGLPPQLIEDVALLRPQATDERSSRCWAVYQAARRVIHDLKGSRMVVLYGDNGVGKSTIAGKLALEAVENREQPYYDTWLSVCQWFEAARTASERPDDDERFRTERALTCHLVSVDLLILDELDKGMGTESKSRALQNLLIKREQFQRPTILLTNAHQAALAVLLGDALIDRLYRGGSVLELKWQSFRAEPAKV